MKLTPLELEELQRRLARNRDPASAKAKEQQEKAVKVQKHEAGKEKELQDQIQADAERRGFYVVRPPMHKRSQLPLGYPDLTIFGPQGRCILIECKAAGGYISDDQERCHAALRAAGALVFTVWNLEDAIDHIRTWLEPGNAVGFANNKAYILGETRDGKTENQP